MNMGTPGSPEGVPHWTNKAMLFNKLKEWQKTQRPFHLFFELGGDMRVVNILEDVTEVLQESPSGGYRPDILLAGCGKRARRTDVVGGASSSLTISAIP